FAISHVASNAFSMLFSSHNNVSSKSNITDFNIILSSFIIYLIFLFLLYYGIYNLSLSPSFFILIEESYFVMNLSLLNLKRSILYVIISSNAFSMLFSSHNNVSSKSNITDFNIILSSFIIYLIFLFLLYYGIYNLSLSPSFFILIEESYFVMNLSLLNLKRSILYVIIC